MTRLRWDRLVPLIASLVFWTAVGLWVHALGHRIG
jgi:hypothetical protein